ncbi:MAG TPA: urease accessory protein UreE [Gammaproteobacteria bacterium]|jgi:urease accessory protein|nr:urease accessory protein UreE [Gammaproteobacteria bacterium]HIO48732.1 urease accessory protein UreE [Candidatus Poribacteria bacterium]HAO87046.1 urease accessory protein UreE [Gammaproteobacteria bacterium]HAU20191.1 urease accessory protein UreE [Gammaproteobacteria bacterium]HBA96054.1 urease accessory protein UreE [Gammaproteobacteria bacterium]
MREFIEKVKSSENVDGSVTLDLQQRVKSRLKTRSDSGDDIGIFMERGTILEDGDLIRDLEGYVLEVVAASETLSSIYSDDPLLLARACYHLGNRHVELQIKNTSIHYRHDHVLDDMIKSFGLDVVIESLPFQPENGAYHSHADSHSHSHEH